MPHRVKKQFIYGGVFLLFWALVIGGVYVLIKPAASCFDNIQNQGEEGIDCGGPCARVCIPVTIRPIQVTGEVQGFYLDGKHMSLMGKIQNANPDWATKQFTYVFHLLDSGGDEIGSVSGNSYIYASEVKYIVEPTVSAPSGVARVELEVRDPQWVKVAQFRRPMLQIQDWHPGTASDHIELDGTISNQDTIVFPSVRIVAIFYGPFGAVGVSQTEITDLAPNQAEQFSVSHPPLPQANVNLTKFLVTAFRP